MFFFRKKEVVVDCFTSDPHVYEHAQVSRAKNFLPDWWRNLPTPDKNEFAPKTNMRHCAGFTDYYKHSFILPLWSELDLEIGAKGTEYYRWQYADRKSNIEIHSPEQWGDFFSNLDFLHLKLLSPWRLQSGKHINFLWSEPTWNTLHSGIRVLPATLDFYYQHDTNINILVERSVDTRVVKLNFNLPLAQLTPITENSVSLKHHLISKSEYSRMDIPTFFFTAEYKKSKTLIDAKKNKRKCPFRKA